MRFISKYFLTLYRDLKEKNYEKDRFPYNCFSFFGF